ncbi:hypothetical protein JCM1840_007358, partial [Sporobolomyces johnsonii]
TKDLVGVALGASIVSPAPGRNSWLIDVPFASDKDFAEALKKPFVYKGEKVHRDYAAPHKLRNSVELRLTALTSQPRDIIGALSQALKSFPVMSLVHVHQHYATITTDTRGAISTQGHLSAFVQVPLPQDRPADHSSLEQLVSAAVPSSIMLEGLEVPIRHSYETAYCPRCRFGGHHAQDCPRFPCGSCFQRGHTASQCTNPTGHPVTYGKTLLQNALGDDQDEDSLDQPPSHPQHPSSPTKADNRAEKRARKDEQQRVKEREDAGSVASSLSSPLPSSPPKKTKLTAFNPQLQTLNPSLSSSSALLPALNPFSSPAQQQGRNARGEGRVGRDLLKEMEAGNAAEAQGDGTDDEGADEMEQDEDSQAEYRDLEHRLLVDVVPSTFPSPPSAALNTTH